MIGERPEGRAARFADTSGIPGVGKTEFIKRVASVAKEQHGIEALPLFAQEFSAPTNLADAYNTFVRHVQVLSTRLTDVFGGNISKLQNQIGTIEQKWVDIEIHNTFDAQNATVGPGGELGVVKVDTGDTAGGIYSSKARQIAKAFGDHFRPVLKRETVVMTLDGYDEIAGHEMGDWLVCALEALPNTLVVVGRSTVMPAPTVAPEQTLAAPLGLFTRDEVRELLARHVADPDPALVDALYEWSEGHPGTAAIAARFLGTLEDPQPTTLEERLAGAPEDVERERAKFALEFVETLGGAGLAGVAEASAVPRVFDGELLAAVLGREVPKGAIDVLSAAGIVEQAGDSGRFRVHGFIRDPFLRQMNETERKTLHRRAAAHEYALLLEEEPELGQGARPYDAWYRYEQPEWQGRLREWLYHQRRGARTPREAERARLQFVRIFLDAFWWWGCYLDLPFCRDLITDWERARDDDADWLADLRLFLDAYPLGWRKHGEGRWDDVEAALLGIRRAAGIAGDAAALKGDDARHTRGLVDNFLAHAARYGAQPATDRAVDYYHEAEGLFTKGKESWELAWTLFEEAELYADEHAEDRARELWPRAVAAALPQDDQELVTNLHRLAADLRWPTDRDGAFDAHARAVLHAYLFQSLTPSNRPDAYTVTFYYEQLQRVAERLREVDDAALPGALERLAAPFGNAPDVDAVRAALATGDGRGLAGTLFPAAPEQAELLQTHSPLTRAIDVFAERMGAAVERDLAGVTP